MDYYDDDDFRELRENVGTVQEDLSTIAYAVTQIANVLALKYTKEHPHGYCWFCGAMITPDEYSGDFEQHTELCIITQCDKIGFKYEQP